MPIEFELIAKMQRKLSAEVSILSGLSQQIIDASRDVALFTTQARSAAERAARFPAGEALTPEQRNQVLTAKADAWRARPGWDVWGIDNHSDMRRFPP